MAVFVTQDPTEMNECLVSCHCRSWKACDEATPVSVPNAIVKQTMFGTWKRIHQNLIVQSIHQTMHHVPLALVLPCFVWSVDTGPSRRGLIITRWNRLYAFLYSNSTDRWRRRGTSWKSGSWTSQSTPCLTWATPKITKPTLSVATSTCRDSGRLPRARDWWTCRCRRQRTTASTVVAE